MLLLVTSSVPLNELAPFKVNVLLVPSTEMEPEPLMAPGTMMLLVRSNTSAPLLPTGPVDRLPLVSLLPTCTVLPPPMFRPPL